MNKKKYFIIASAILIVGIVGSLLTYRAVRTPISEVKTFDSDEVAAIHINADNSTITVVSIESEKIQVGLGGLISSNNGRELSADINNSTLYVSLKEQQARLFNFGFIHEELEITVFVPEKQFDSLKVFNDNGKTSVEQLNAAEINITSNNGRIELENIVSESTNVKSDNGKVTLNNVEGELTGKSNNGQITLITKDIDRNIDFQTDNGSIKIETETEPTNVQFSVSVDNGKLNILDKYQGNAVIGDGENLIKLTSNNGSITVTEK